MFVYLSSAGVGRTGTFIVMDVMLQKLANEQALNIHEFVLGMRYQRTNMVQTEVSDHKEAFP